LDPVRWRAFKFSVAEKVHSHGVTRVEYTARFTSASGCDLDLRGSAGPTGPGRQRQASGRRRRPHVLEARVLKELEDFLGLVEGVNRRGKVGGCGIVGWAESEHEPPLGPQHAAQLVEVGRGGRPKVE